MQVHRTDSAVCFNVWTSHRTWFWSLIYPDREGGAVGAATTEAEAVHEAHAAIERLPHQRHTVLTLFAPGEDSKFTRRCQSSNDSQFHIGREIDAGNGKLASSNAAQKRRTKIPALYASYGNLWRLTLHQYAVRVAHA